MEQRMTICNMSIEGGARAGLVAPDDTTFEYVAGRPHAPKGAAWDAAVAALAERSRPTTARRSTSRSRSTPRRSSRWSPTARTRAWASRSRRSVPDPGGDGGRRPPARPRAGARVHGPPARPADPRPEGRRRVHRLVHERPDQRPAARGRRARGPAGRRRRADDGRPGLGRGEARGRARGPRRDLPRRGRRLARGRLLDVHRDERRPALAGPVRGEHVEPQLRGPAGQGRPDVPRVAADRRRVGDRRRHRRPAPPARASRRSPRSGVASRCPSPSRRSPARSSRCPPRTSTPTRSSRRGSSR